MSEYNNRLCQWAKEAARVYNKIGREINHNYYNQSCLDKLKRPPRILICGINPGSGKDNFHPHTADEIMSGNTVWSVEQWSNIKRFGLTQQELSECVLTNFTMFASKEAKEVDHLVASTISVTKKMFEAIEPEMIILLSGDNAFRLLRKYGNKNNEKPLCSSEYIMKTASNKILLGYILDIPTLGIPHPNRCPTPYKIANVVRAFINGERQICKLKEAYERVKESVTIDDLWNVISELGIEPQLNNNPKTKIFKLSPDLELIVTKTGGGYAFIRMLNGASLDLKGKYRKIINLDAGWQQRNYDPNDIGTLRLKEIYTIEDFKNQIIKIKEQVNL